MKTRIQIPSTSAKATDAQMLCVLVAPALGDRNRQILRVQWPASLAEMVSCAFTARFCLKWIRQTGGRRCTILSGFCVNTHIQKKRKTGNVISSRIKMPFHWTHWQMWRILVIGSPAPAPENKHGWNHHKHQDSRLERTVGNRYSSSQLMNLILILTLTNF